MKKNQMLYVSLTVAILLVMVVGVSRAQRPEAAARQDEAQPLASAGTAFTYQGSLKKNGNPVNATCAMIFNLYNQSAGGTLVAGPLNLSVPVSNSLFTARLDFGAGAFNGEARWLGIQVQCPGDASYADLGRQELTPVPYALQAVGSPYQNVIIVAMSGGDFTDVQQAINSITDAAADNPYLVWIAPGVYRGTVVMKPYVDLQGAGQGTTILASKNGSDVWPPTTAGLILAANTSLRDLTLENTGTYTSNVTLMASDGVTGTLVSGVTVQAQGAGLVQNAAIYQNGANSSLTLVNVTALAENAATYNYAAYRENAHDMTIHGGSFTALGGYYAYALYQRDAGTALEAWDVTALAEGGTDNYGFYSAFNAAATLHSGSFTGRGGAHARGIFNYQVEFSAEGVTALGENGSDYNYGLYLGQNSTATVHGGSFTARGGNTTFGIYNTSSDLTAESVTALGAGGASENNGLRNMTPSTIVLTGGSFTGRSGTTARGIYNSSGLEAYNTFALGEDGTNNYGLDNEGSGDARLDGCSFTGRGGNYAVGIYTTGASSNLDAKNLKALGVDGATNRGVECNAGGKATITESVLEGASNSITTTGGGGPATLSNTRLVGAWGGNVTCTAVSRGTTFNASGCP